MQMLATSKATMFFRGVAWVLVLAGVAMTAACTRRDIVMNEVARNDGDVGAATDPEAHRIDDDTIELVHYEPKPIEPAPGNGRWMDDPKRARINQVRYSSDGAYLACGASSEFIYIWEATTHKLLWKLQFSGVLGEWDFHPAQPHLIAVQDSKGIALFDVGRRSLVWRTKESDEELQRICFSPTGSHILCWRKNRLLVGADVPKTQLLMLSTRDGSVTRMWQLDKFNWQGFAFCWAPNDAFIVALASKSELKMLDPREPTEHATLRLPASEADMLNHAAVDPTGRYVIGTCGGHVLIWNVEDGSIAHDMEVDYFIRAITFADKATAVLAGRGNFLALLDTRSGKITQIKLEGPSDNDIYCVSVTSDGKRAYTGGTAGVVAADMVTHGVLWSTYSHRFVHSVAIAPGVDQWAYSALNGVVVVKKRTP